MSPKVQRFEANTAGRDFVVGDVHGMVEMLCKEMDSIRFNPAKDRLFSVGDLVDRGPQSKDALNWMPSRGFTRSEETMRTWRSSTLAVAGQRTTIS